MGLLDDFSNLSDSAKQYALNALGRFGNSVGDTVNAIPGNAQRLAQGLLTLPQTMHNELGGLLSPQMNQRVQQTYQPTPSSLITNPPQPANQQQWMNQGMALAGMAPLGGLVGHTVYHGSPHKFDAFDMSKIGTGEGGQAYGHGLYFAESPDVAESYVKSTTRTNNGIPKSSTSFDVAGKQIYKDDDLYPAAEVANMMQKYSVDPKSKDGAQWLSDELGARYMAGRSIDKKTVLSMLKNGIKEDTTVGNFYKVDIPDESIPRMLDWDKPLSEQHPDVQKALAGFPPDMTGKETVLSAGRPDAEMSAFLKSQGIPGIRYLDGSSRNAGQGTSNFVLFDDQLPRILEVNGQPTGLKPWNAK